MKAPRSVWLTSLVVAVGIAGVTAGCGSSSSTSGGSSGSSSVASASTGGQGDSACPTTAKGLVADYRKPLPFDGPPGPVNMAKMKGKTLWDISLISNPFTDPAAAGFQAAAQAVGATGKVFDAKGNITLANQGMSTAIAQRAGGIVLFNIDPKDVAGEVQSARAAGIPVIDVNDSNPNTPPYPGTFGHVTSNWTVIGKMFADYMLAQTDCKLDALILYAKVIPILADAEAGTVAEIKRLCPGCKMHIEEIDLSTLATSLGPLAQTALTQDPSINYITPMADAFAELVEPAVTQAGKQVPIISHDGLPAALKEIRAGGGLLKATIANPPPVFFGWAAVDQLGRAVAGQRPAIWALPNQFIDSTNIASSDATQFPNYNGFEAKFKQAWGVS